MMELCKTLKLNNFKMKRIAFQLGNAILIV